MTLEQAQTILDAHLAALESFDGSTRVSYQSSAGKRDLEFTDLTKLEKAVAYWSRVVARKQRVAAGGPVHGHSLADFRE